MKKLVLLSLVIFAITANAQPVLTAANTNPVIGDGFKWIYENNVSSLGNAGANQTWDFSSMVASGLTEYDTVIPAYAAPSAVDYPEANIAFHNLNYDYYSFDKACTDSLVFYGTKGLSFQDISTDPAKYLTYPFSFDSTFNDNQYSNDNSGGTLYYTTGSRTVLADGYGTLILPTGTFSNVLRVKITGSYYYSSSSNTNYYTYYYFYLPGIHQPILTLGKSGNNYAPLMLKIVASGINETPISSVKIKLFPDPANDNINIETSLPASIEILNPEGQLLMEIKEVKNSFNLDISTFAKGLYYVKLITHEGIAVKKFIKE